MARRHPLILNIALPVPLRRSFDYLLKGGEQDPPLQPGLRIKVPFGQSRTRTGILLGVARITELPLERLKPIISVIDRTPVFDTVQMKLLLWASDYYHHPIGEVLFGALPSPLKRGEPIKTKIETTWRLTDAGKDADLRMMKRAPAQARLMVLMQTCPAGELQQQLKHQQWRNALAALCEKGLIERCPADAPPAHPETTPKIITLNPDQTLAADRIKEHLNEAKRYLLYGVTGSGKTEVYIEIIKAVLAAGRQALVLVPEIGLTPQLVQRLSEGVGAHPAVLHSALSEGERVRAWRAAEDGTAAIILGTRSAVWAPLKHPGVLIIDEEHDASYKQQEGFRYSARDVAVMRAKISGVPVVLGTATPSMESMQNVHAKKFSCLPLDSRAGDAGHPAIIIVDMRSKAMRGALSFELIDAITAELNKHNQVLLFLNQRGFSPMVMCHVCGWTAKCKRCDARMIFHKRLNIYSCHRCSAQSRPVATCPDCGGGELLQLGHGTERLTETVAELFPAAKILRIDRDSTRRKGAIQAMFKQINAGEADILIGTQMLAKGHHFPKLTLVGIIDSDRGLFSADFRASERMAQLFIQVSGRAGRETTPGKVMIQTHYPHHPIILSMAKCNYSEFTEIILRERREANLPPFSYMTVLRAEDHRRAAVERFLSEAKRLLTSAHPGLEAYGPMPAILEKHAGRFRYQLLIQSNDRNLMQRALAPWSRSLETLPSAKRVRWSLDVDPQELM
jgi:primosomal protein N' (replication factor Y)